MLENGKERRLYEIPLAKEERFAIIKNMYDGDV